ncbi:MAG: hypothetical protein R6X02_11995 [Enhygromyxa sp.]
MSHVSLSLVVCLGAVGCTPEPEPSGDDEVGDGDGDPGDGDSGDGDSGDGDPGDGDSGDGDGDPHAGPTYWKDVKAVLDSACVSCHVDGGIGPFALATWEQVEAFAPILAPAIADLSMPPWPPNAECNSYEEDRSLSEAERELLLEWIAIGYPEGDSADAPAEPEPPAPFVADFTVSLPEPYTPSKTPDDYRCFVIPWPEELSEPVYVTGQMAYPDQQQIVHHVVTFVADPGAADFFIELDANDPGPGYECFGGPGALDWSARWLGDWVPGIDAWQAPEGTGIEIKPGSVLIVQAHYNTLASPGVADQTSLGFQITDSVERPGTFIPIMNYQWLTGADPMTIPAGESEVHHSVTIPREHPLFDVTLATIGATSSVEVDVWRAFLHMHLLGTHARLSMTHADDEQSCLLQIDDWDFNWQGDYMLTQPVGFGPGDAMQLDCWYDNSEANQPIIDGEPKTPTPVGWGEGTLDEMCLGIVYAARK